jgi:hypothetical protein
MSLAIHVQFHIANYPLNNQLFDPSLLAALASTRSDPQANRLVSSVSAGGSFATRYWHLHMRGRRPQTTKRTETALHRPTVRVAFVRQDPRETWESYRVDRALAAHEKPADHVLMRHSEQ